MGKRGPVPKKVIDETWSSDLAYAIGLIATDGSLSRSGFAVDITSKDKEQLQNFSIALQRTFHIGKKRSGAGKISYRIQFRNVLFYQFLVATGLTPAKSKTVKSLRIPRTYFFDFLRGVFDGDGSSYSYFDPRWRSSFMFYISFASASPTFIRWLKAEISTALTVTGHITHAKDVSTHQLKFAKKDALLICRQMYRFKGSLCLKRKRLKIARSLAMMGEHL